GDRERRRGRRARGLDVRAHRDAGGRPRDRSLDRWRARRYRAHAPRGVGARRLVAALAEPCGGGRGTPGYASDSALAQLRGSGPLVATRALETRTATSGRLATWLLVGALAPLLLE